MFNTWVIQLEPVDHTLLLILREPIFIRRIMYISDLFYSFDPNFPIMATGMRFPPPAPMPISTGEDIEVDEHGNYDWRGTWLKELGHLQQITAEQDKAQVDPEWYRMMLFRVRSALMTPSMNPEAVVQVPGGMPNPPNAGEQQQQ